MTNLEIQQLYEKYGFMIFGRCQKILGSSDEAHDALQVVFMKLLEKYDSIKDKTLVIPWLFRVAQNYCFNVLRKNKKFSEEVNVEEIGSIDSFDEQIGKSQLLTRILGRVDRKIRDAVYYSFIEGLKQSEITKITGQSPATIRRNLKRFRELLPGVRKELELG